MATGQADGFWNAGAERVCTIAQDEAVGHTSHALLQTEFPIRGSDLRSQLRDRRNWLGELHHICKDDGSKVIVDSHMQLFGDNLVLEADSRYYQTTPDQRRALAATKRNLRSELQSSKRQTRNWKRLLIASRTTFGRRFAMSSVIGAV